MSTRTRQTTVRRGCTFFFAMSEFYPCGISATNILRRMQNICANVLPVGFGAGILRGMDERGMVPTDQRGV
jgi:hypothetical protein